MKLHSTRPRRGRKGALGAVLLTVALAAAGCQAADAPEEGDPPSDQVDEGDEGEEVEQDVQSLSFGVLRAPTGALATVVDEHGWYDEAGVDPEFKSFAEGGGPAIIQAMAGGEPDIALLNLATTILALGQGTFDVQIVSVASNPARALPLISTDDIQSVEDLRGKRVSAPPSGGLYYVLAASLDKFGMTFDDIDFRPLPAGEGQAAFLTGSVDAVVSSANGAQVILSSKDDAHVLFDGTDFAPEDRFGMPDVIIATQDAVKNKPEAITRFLKAYHDDGVNYLLDPETSKDAVQEIQDYMVSVGAGVELELTQSVVDAIQWYNLEDATSQIQSEDFLETAKAQAQFWVDQGVLDAAPDIESAINPDLISQ